MKKISFIIMIAYFILSCNQNHETNSTDTHETETEQIHEEPKISLTAYSNDFELFAEADPFIAGKESNVLTHFTWLSNFSPLDSAIITLQLEINGKQVSETSENPLKKGIYSFNIIPTIAGAGRIIFDIKSKMGNFEITVENIRVFETEEEADKVAHAAEPSQTNTTTFTKEQSWKIDFATENPKVEPFGQMIKTTALVESAPTDEIIITAKTNGIVTFSGNNFLEGKDIKAGENLFTISGNSFADNNSAVRYTEAKNNYEKATSDYERIRELAQEKIVSEKELLATKNVFENTKVIFENLDKNFNAAGQIGNSPLSGFIKQIFVQNGKYLEAGQPVASVSQNKLLLLSAEIQPKYVSILGKFESANILLPENQKTYSLEELNGGLLSFGKATNQNNYLIPVNLQIENNGEFVPGSFVTVYIKTISSEQALTIPNSALLEEQGDYFVFVQITPELFEIREIETGETDGTKTKVTAGISANERIVSKGAVLIKLSQATGTLDAHSGHVH